jgi:hypothetical protein
MSSSGVAASACPLLPGAKLRRDRKRLHHDDDRQQAEAAHHIDHAAEAGRDLGRVLGGKLGIEDAER